MSSPLIELEAAAFGYENETVVSDVSLRVDAGELVLLTGVNGSGKTTVIRGILGMAKQRAGNVRWRLPRNRVGYVPQESAIGADIPATALDMVRIGAVGASATGGWSWGKTRGPAMAALRSVGLEEKAKTRFGKLSGGQKRRTLLAKALVREPLLLILDEPTANVDRDSEAAIAGLLHRLTAANVGVLATAHSGAWAAEARRVAIRNGRAA